jgi:hypothetical protein
MKNKHRVRRGSNVNKNAILPREIKNDKNGNNITSKKRTTGNIT